eukprot:1245211-Ditylum_brightwellii.AAC.1
MPVEEGDPAVDPLGEYGCAACEFGAEGRKVVEHVPRQVQRQWCLQVEFVEALGFRDLKAFPFCCFYCKPYHIKSVCLSLWEGKDGEGHGDVRSVPTGLGGVPVHLLSLPGPKSSEGRLEGLVSGFEVPFLDELLLERLLAQVAVRLSIECDSAEVST